MGILGEIIGYAAIVASVLIYQQKTERNILLNKALTDSLWITHYALIGAYTGAAVSGVALLRGIVLFCNERRGVKSKGVLALFLAASAVCTALTWKDAFSIFPAVASLLAVVSFWIGNPKVLRLLSFPISACMMLYGIHNGSTAATINEGLVMLSSCLALVRNRKK